MAWFSERDLAAPGAVRLLTLPHAGSGAAIFYGWRRALPTSIAVCPAMLPGRELRLREPALRTVEEIVAGLHHAFGKRLQERPYAIFGHSMGALLAWAWARRIAADGLPAPVRLIVSGRESPDLPFAHRGLHRLPDAAFLAELKARYGGVPVGLLEDEEMRTLFLPTLRADIGVVERFTAANPGVMVGAPVLALAGEDDGSVSDAGLLGWRRLTGGGFQARRLPGDHFYPMGEGREALLGLLARELAGE